MSITVSPFFNDEQQLTGAIVLLRDVTEQQKEHERNQQADKLRALGQLASGVAHNFNNALAAVIGYTQLALPKVRDTDIEKYLMVVEQSAKDAARMVERIQNFSRAASHTDDFFPISVSEIVKDAIDITRPRWRTDAEALGITYNVTVSFETTEQPLIKAEPSEMREVFVNIILNALDSMPIGGSLHISTKGNGNTVSIGFTDTGTGMTEEIKRRVFEPFFTTKGVSGLGMGLSESYRILERHGGRIEVESELRKGTTFTVVLPSLSEPPETQLLEDFSLRDIPSMRVLVIDDEEFVRNVLSAILEEEGHTVTLASSGEEALQMVKVGTFEVVFTDLAMPGMDGVAAANEIKQRSPQTKVILMSGYGSDKAYERAGDTNCIDAAISKPFRLSEIRSVMKASLARHPTPRG